MCFVRWRAGGVSPRLHVVKPKTPEATIPSGPGLGMMLLSQLGSRGHVQPCECKAWKRFWAVRIPNTGQIAVQWELHPPLLHLYRRVLSLVCKNGDARPLFQNPQRRKDGETLNKPLRMNHRKSQRLPVH